MMRTTICEDRPSSALQFLGVVISLHLVLTSIAQGQSLGDLTRRANPDNSPPQMPAGEAPLTHELVFTIYVARGSENVDHVAIASRLISDNDCAWKKLTNSNKNPGYNWQTLRNSDPPLADTLLDVVLGVIRPEALGKPGWIRLFSCEEIAGRRLEFLSRELAPVTKEFLDALRARAQKHVPKRIKIVSTTRLPLFEYDFEQGALVFHPPKSKRQVWPDKPAKVQALPYRQAKPEEVAHLDAAFKDRMKTRYVVSTSPSEASKKNLETIGQWTTMSTMLYRLRESFMLGATRQSGAVWLDRRLDLQGGYAGPVALGGLLQLVPQKAEELLNRQPLTARVFLTADRFSFGRGGTDILGTLDRVELLDTNGNIAITLGPDKFPTVTAVAARDAETRAKAERQAGLKRQQVEVAARNQQARNREIEQLQDSIVESLDTCDSGDYARQLACLKSTCPEIDTLQDRLSDLRGRNVLLVDCNERMVEVAAAIQRSNDMQKRATQPNPNLIPALSKSRERCNSLPNPGLKMACLEDVCQRLADAKAWQEARSCIEANIRAQMEQLRQAM